MQSKEAIEKRIAELEENTKEWKGVLKTEADNPKRVSVAQHIISENAMRIYDLKWVLGEAQ